MKRWQAVLLMFIAGCVLAWLGVVVAGIASALVWPARLAESSKAHPFAVHYSATVVLHFLPMFVVSLSSGLALFRLFGTRVLVLLAGIAPHVLLLWVFGVVDRFFPPIVWFLLGLTVISIAAIPTGLCLAWWLSNRKPLTLPSSGRPPAGFAA